MLNALIKIYFNVLAVSNSWLHGQVCVLYMIFIKFYACINKFSVLVNDEARVLRAWVSIDMVQVTHNHFMDSWWLLRANKRYRPGINIRISTVSVHEIMRTAKTSFKIPLLHFEIQFQMASIFLYSVAM